jgi:hypothetical protein
MKLKQIDFDHTLIGTEGIVVKYRNGEAPDFIKVYGDIIVTIDRYGHKMCLFLDGSIYPNDLVKRAKDLVMYRTVKVMTFEEWKDSAYPLYTIMSEGERETFLQNRAGADALAAAIKRGEVDTSDING